MNLSVTKIKNFKKHLGYAVLCGISCLGCEEILFEEDLTEEELQLIAPLPEAVIETTQINFSWEPVAQASGYRLQIAKPSFVNATQMVRDTVVLGTNFTTSLTKSDYEWRVRAENGGSATAFASASFSIKESEDFTSREVVLLSPGDNSITNKNTVSLQWETVTDANLYRIQLRKENEDLIVENTITSTSSQLTFPEGTTNWQVRAENTTQSTLYSKRTITVDTKNPKQPNLTAPVNQATLTSDKVNFTWTRELVLGTTEFDSIYIYKNPELTQLEIKDEVTSPVEITLTTGTTYFWFIKAFDAAGNQSESSTVSEFTIN
ncbi:hypothetical protein ACE939_11030 [Aquimarina sp. W85]|uniref:hypothetical protein n=1 Tax=Aquimarina rhodophyticola TaxID=3342246 RepID=UPI00366E9B8B